MIRYGLFAFGSFDYAISLQRMRKIVHQFSGYRLPRIPDAVAEILVCDGQLVPLLKLSNSGGIMSSSARLAEYKVLTESEAGLVAFPADVACGIAAEGKGELSEAEGEPISGVAGIFNYQGQKFKILDIDLLALKMTQGV